MKPWLLAAAALLAQDKEEPRPGLIAEYFDIGEDLNDFPNLKAMKPHLRRIDAQVNTAQTNGNFAGSGLIDHFFVRWTGLIRIPQAGKYTFYTESDDGSRLLIGGKLVVDNGGLHPPQERDGQIELKAGDHEIRIEFFEAGGGASCKVRWESDDFRNEAIPARVFFLRKDADLDK